MIPMAKIFKVYSNEPISSEFLSRIQTHNYTNIPVFEKENNTNIKEQRQIKGQKNLIHEHCIGFIKAKQLIRLTGKDPLNKKPLKERLNILKPLIVSYQCTIFDLLMLFQQMKQSIALVSDMEIASIEATK